MALVIEDGTGLANAQAYANVATVVAYAALRGTTLPSDATVIEPLIVLATDYLESLDYILRPYTKTQALEWPRSHHFCDPCVGLTGGITDPLYPQKALQAATAQLVMDQKAGVTLQPTVAGGTQFVVEERVDVIMTRYSEKLGTLSTPTLHAVNDLLRGLVVPRPILRTVRV